MRNAQLEFMSLVTSVLVLSDTRISYHVIVTKSILVRNSAVICTTPMLNFQLVSIVCGPVLCSKSMQAAFNLLKPIGHVMHQRFNN
jgi:hypothetical protein